MAMRGLGRRLFQSSFGWVLLLAILCVRLTADVPAPGKGFYLNELKGGLEGTPDTVAPGISPMTDGNLATVRGAAEHGDAKAQNQLGLLYDEGRVVPKNQAEAVKWYRKAAEQGLASAPAPLHNGTSTKVLCPIRRSLKGR